MFGALFGQVVDMEQAKVLVDRIETFCAANWWAGPFIILALALLSGYNKKQTAKRTQREKDDAIAAARSQEQAIASSKASLSVKPAYDVNRVLTPAEKVQKVVKTAIELGVDKWEWSATAYKLTCIAAGFDKLILAVTEPKQAEGTHKGVLCSINGENVNNVIGTELSAECGALVKAKWTALEDARLMNLAGMIGGSVPPVVAPVTPSVTESALHATDATYGSKLYDKLVALLSIKARWCGPVAQDANFYTDNNGISFKVYSPTEVEIFVAGHSVMMLFSPAQQVSLAKICYEKASTDANRRTHLDAAVLMVDKLYANRG